MGRVRTGIPRVARLRNPGRLQRRHVWTGRIKNPWWFVARLRYLMISPRPPPNHRPENGRAPTSFEAGHCRRQSSTTSTTTMQNRRPRKRYKQMSSAGTMVPAPPLPPSRPPAPRGRVVLHPVEAELGLPLLPTSRAVGVRAPRRRVHGTGAQSRSPPLHRRLRGADTVERTHHQRRQHAEDERSDGRRSNAPDTHTRPAHGPHHVPRSLSDRTRRFRDSASRVAGLALRPHLPGLLLLAREARGLSPSIPGRDIPYRATDRGPPGHVLRIGRERPPRGPRSHRKTTRDHPHEGALERRTTRAITPPYLEN